jgi:hypothetical protein
MCGLWITRLFRDCCARQGTVCAGYRAGFRVLYALVTCVTCAHSTHLSRDMRASFDMPFGHICMFVHTLSHLRLNIFLFYIRNTEVSKPVKCAVFPHKNNTEVSKPVKCAVFPHKNSCPRYPDWLPKSNQDTCSQSNVISRFVNTECFLFDNLPKFKKMCCVLVSFQIQHWLPCSAVSEATLQ